LATLGGHLSDGVSADGVGRRGHFLEGRFPPEFEPCCPSGKCTERGRLRPRRPGLENGSRDSFRKLQPRPSGTPFGRTSVAFSASPQRGDRCYEIAGSQKRRAAAYGVGRDSIAEGAAVDCPVSPFFASTVRLGGLPGEERAHLARPVQEGAFGFRS